MIENRMHFFKTMASLKVVCCYKYMSVKCLDVKLNLRSNEEEFNLIFNTVVKYILVLKII